MTSVKRDVGLFRSMLRGFIRRNLAVQKEIERTMFRFNDVSFGWNEAELERKREESRELDLLARELRLTREQVKLIKEEELLDAIHNNNGKE